ncbi:MAG TPA: winged helix DNA-binding domain-containing protein [Micromonosporaceae bacterium]|nr:winged helix DNA-binding domain-containing protein [Micromonosporaceae bacterium]
MEVTWSQVLAWRLRRQFLDPRTDSDPVTVARRLCGIQAQLGSAAELAVAARQRDPERGVVDRALADRKLVKTWAMRGTLHLLTPEEAGAYLALIRTARTWERPSWQRAFGVTAAELAGLLEAVGEALDHRVLTRDELIEQVLVRTGSRHMAEQLRSGWGAVLKPLAWSGLLCHGPGQGNRVTFTRPDTWLPDWGGLPEPEAAARLVIPAYLRAYGPATPETFDAWLSRGASRKKDLRGWFATVSDELATVTVAGRDCLLLAEDVDDLAETEPTETVRLLPGFDQYVLGPGTRDTELISADRWAQVSRAAGWISPVVVCAGRVTGTWEISADTVTVTWFPEAGPVPAEALSAEAEWIAGFRGEELTVKVSVG